jgi:hypothetical protein
VEAAIGEGAVVFVKEPPVSPEVGLKGHGALVVARRGCALGEGEGRGVAGVIVGAAAGGEAEDERCEEGVLIFQSLVPI